MGYGKNLKDILGKEKKLILTHLLIIVMTHI